MLLLQVTVNPIKTVNNSNPVVGEVIEYNLTVNNTGSVVISDNVTLVDSLPDGLVYAGDYSVVGGKVVKFAQSGNKLIWVVSDIAPGSSMIITVKVKVVRDGSWTNNLTLNGNFTVNATVTTVNPIKTVNNSNPVVGEVIEYNLTVNNTGSVVISDNVTLVDSLPDGLVYAGDYSVVGGKVVKFAQSGNKLIWVVSDIAPGSSMIITVKVKVVRDGSWTNNLTLNGNFTVNATVTTVNPIKTVNNSNPVVGEVIEYNLTVNNTGSVVISDNVTLVDSLPDGLVYAGDYSVVGGKVVKFAQSGNKLIWVVSDIW
ncbi:hypothetical protein [Methanobrevibacter sp. V74]|uniref:hypothetical protein n=1 Tax=Methanobrevibacter sp. V74 TaxID=3064279 RepID=UPI002732BC00|nr:hypothetical protein [Methanobrevibacter sp. V74]